MSRSSALKNFIKKYKHAWVFLYAFIYMPWFMYLEKHITAESEYHVIHSVLDDKIPFVEYFIVPYLLWFVFIAAVFLYFFFTDVEGFYKLAKLSFIGMTIFLLISTVFPNGLTLRPVVFPRDNIYRYGQDVVSGRYPDECISESSCVQFSGCMYCNRTE